jgi:hypothetical protein
MKTTIEQIKGEPYTVVWHKPQGWAESIDCDTKDIKLADGSYIRLAAYMGAHVATALPALPKKPTEKHAELLHLYAARGLIAMFDDLQFCCAMCDSEHIQTITHAITASGERVEIARKE